jgi:hypothetical protein
MKDVALVIRYQFGVSSSSSVPSSSKKRKLNESQIIDYSYLKLPAVVFVKYLETYSYKFIDDCLR